MACWNNSPANADGNTALNGSMQSQTIVRPGLNVTQTYSYDGVNRLTSAVESGVWFQAYVYDKAGNAG